MDNQFLDFIWQKESSQGKNPNKMATNGDYQIKEIAYEDVKRFDDKVKKWTYEEVINDPAKGRYVADGLFNKVYPVYIKAYKLPDTTETKIAMWNWGVGKVKGVSGDLTKAPEITKKYIRDYQTLLTNKK
jgi:hypothetical protein